METITIVVSTIAGLILAVLSNWLYDILRAKGFLPEKPTLKRILIVIIGFVPFLVLVVLSTFWRTDHIMQLEEGYDFITQARTAEWSNGSKILTFPGKRVDRDGFVFYGSYETLENNEISRSFLQMHPPWEESYGIIKGKYGPFKITKDLKIRCQVGFLIGPQATDGVKFQIEFESKDHTDREVLYEKISQYDGRIDEFTVPLNQIANKKGYIILSVNSLENSGQDWSVWSIARVIR